MLYDSREVGYSSEFFDELITRGVVVSFSCYSWNEYIFAVTEYYLARYIVKL